jgi:UDP-GlcNAc:undecaprenyl-phosphate GlcNAc-1-phosphate transferase
MLSLSAIELLYSFTVALFLTTALIPLCIRFAPALGLLDLPDSRKVHVRAIPRCGGLGMAIGIALPLLWFLPANDFLLHFFAACCVIVVFGLLDDRNDLDYRWKFFAQILAVIMVMRGGLVLHHVPLLGLDDAPPALTYPLTFLFLLGTTNAVNLTDGLDGLAAGTTLLALTFLFALTQQSDNAVGALIAITVIGGILGFLRFNTFPAQVFMGDAGSQLLGFVAACLSIQITQSGTSVVSSALPLLVLGLPVLDTLTVMTIRLAQKRSPFAPDRNHLHHQIIALGFRHNEAVAIIYLLQIALLSTAFILRYAADQVLLALYAVFCTLLIATLHIARRRGWRMRDETLTQTFVDRRNLFLRKLQWFYLRSGYVVQLLLAALLIIPIALGGAALPSRLLVLLPIIALAALLHTRAPGWATRLAIYPASVISVYLLSAHAALQPWIPMLNAGFIALAVILALAIRMTRREQFQLDTQDLLILAMVLVIPLLPFDILKHYPIGEFTLRLSVLMYSCEFIIGKTATKTLLPINGVVLLVALTLTGLPSFF